MMNIGFTGAFSPTPSAVANFTRSNVLVYRPAGPANAKNVFTTWAALYTVVQSLQGPVIIEMDPQGDPLGVDIPVGTYDLSDVTLASRGVPVDGVTPTIINLLDGVQITKLYQVGIDVEIHVNATVIPVMEATPAIAQFLVLDRGGCIKSFGSQPFLHVQAGATATLAMIIASKITKDNPGASAVISVDAGGFFDVPLVGAFVNIDEDTIDSAVGANVRLEWGSSSSRVASQAGLLGSTAYGISPYSSGQPLKNTGARFYHLERNANATVTIAQAITEGSTGVTLPIDLVHSIELTNTGARIANLPDTVESDGTSVYIAAGRVLVLSDGAGTAGGVGTGITINPTGTDLINGVNAPITITSNYGVVTLECVLARTMAPDPVAPGEWRIIGRMGT